MDFDSYHDSADYRHQEDHWDYSITPTPPYIQQPAMESPLPELPTYEESARIGSLFRYSSSEDGPAFPDYPMSSLPPLPIDPSTKFEIERATAMQRYPQRYRDTLDELI